MASKVAIACTLCICLAACGAQPLLGLGIGRRILDLETAVRSLRAELMVQRDIQRQQSRKLNRLMDMLNEGGVKGDPGPKGDVGPMGLVGEPGSPGPKGVEEWEEIINVILKNNVARYNAKDFHSLVQDFSVNAHRLPPKSPIAIGHQEIEEQYRNFPAVPLNEMDITHIPYFSNDAAVFEFSSSVKGVGITFKGAGLVVMEGGQPKMSMFTFNYDK